MALEKGQGIKNIEIQFIANYSTYQRLKPVVCMIPCHWPERCFLMENVKPTVALDERSQLIKIVACPGPMC